MNEIKIIRGTEKELQELQANLFNRLVVEEGSVAHQMNGTEEDGFALKVDLSYYNEPQTKLIETAMKARISSGLLDATKWEVNEDAVKNSFCLTADSAQKLEIILNDILRGAKIPEDSIMTLQQPFAPGMVSTLTTVIIAFDLDEDQMKAIELSAKVAKQGIKVQNFAKKASMVATSTANVTNRVGREVLLAGTEIGATVLAGTVKTGIEMTACAINIGVRDLNHKELMKGDNVQALKKTITGLWKKDESKITNGFACL